jgi:hypothetical protein
LAKSVEIIGLVFQKSGKLVGEKLITAGMVLAFL